MAEGDRETRLATFVAAEARRVLSEQQLRPDPALVAEGWERRFLGDAARVQEAADLYRELGFEVKVVPLDTEELAAECQDCYLAGLANFQTVYVRRPKAG